MEPIKIYGHVAGSHPWKIIILLKELGVPYQIEFLPAEEMKSGTIIEYLEDMYDQDDKLKYSSFPEKHHQRNWKDYQIAGHDLFLGQKAYFTNAITSDMHHRNMVRWVLGVLGRHSAKTGHPYLVGDKCTYADLMYIPFHLVLADKLMSNEKFPRCYEWNRRVVRRERVQQALEEKYQAMGAAGWPR
ncbi:hypothetical protein LY76DRAFT_613123 [Colletotrichum caudatum]|nr:hypothetical protein LY76DRAFT_613123 [Colletotrichum caudatum]